MKTRQLEFTKIAVTYTSLIAKLDIPYITRSDHRSVHDDEIELGSHFRVQCTYLDDSDWVPAVTNWSREAANDREESRRR